MYNSIGKILNSYIQTDSLNGLLANIFIVFSRYELFYSDCSENDSILLFVGFEKVSRKDHFSQHKMLFNAINDKKRYASIVGFRRKLSLVSLQSFFKLRSVKNLAFRQMEEAFAELDILNYKKCLVQCDIVPIQAFVVTKCNILGLETFSLQHGFYPKPTTSKQWLTEYECSDSKVFFAWDSLTISFFKSVNKSRKYIEAGPFLSDEEVLVPSQEQDGRIVVFLPSKSDFKEVAFLIRLGVEYLHHGEDVTFACHPNYTAWNRLFLKLKYGIQVKTSSFKKLLNQEDICFVLNSSVWVDLELNGIKAIILDETFYCNRSFNVNFHDLKSFQNIYQRRPFVMGSEAVSVISREMLKNVS